MRELPFRPESVEVLLFDLGGVVIDIDFRRCFAHWADSADRDVEELVSLFTIDAAYEAHERGRLPISEYLEHLRGTLGLALTDDELLAGWNDIWTGANRDIGPLLTVASDAFPLYAFTNSNPTHQAVWSRRFAEPLGTFTATFVSSEIGHRKPDRAAFDHVASTIGALPGSVLFFDDGSENVTGARVPECRLSTSHLRAWCGTRWLQSARSPTGRLPDRRRGVRPTTRPSPDSTACRPVAYAASQIS